MVVLSKIKELQSRLPIQFNEQFIDYADLPVSGFRFRCGLTFSEITHKVIFAQESRRSFISF